MTYQQHLDLQTALSVYDVMADSYHMSPTRAAGYETENWRECPAEICRKRSEHLGKAVDALEAEWKANVDRYVAERAEGRA